MPAGTENSNVKEEMAGKLTTLSTMPLDVPFPMELLNSKRSVPSS
jgi:hypothetical protein